MARPKIGQKRRGSGQLVPVVPRRLVPNVQYRDFGAAFCTRVCTRSEGMCLRWPPNRDCTRCVWPPQEVRVKKKQARLKKALCILRPSQPYGGTDLGRTDSRKYWWLV